ncbi:stalk domain-containing protein [Paenibacillus validus]|uniref:stalk domain-containing protein n=1 Tax=Paenibacillus validus TaxID=44253 RepID=UPI0013DF9E6A|nr:stalk domain-containing protein [Paenibacillus validus]MED4600868.1 stalk domain-containing protein [Paenibacillus validus]MED4606640.1 stalk domain-containing protein [Paenibacillus validus]
MKKKHVLSFTLLAALLAAQEHTASAQVSGTKLHLQLQDKQLSATVNGSAVSLETAAQIVDGSFYIPIRWAAQQLGMEMKWNEERKTAGLTTPSAYLEWDLVRQTVSVNGASTPLKETSFMDEGALLVKLSWIAPYLQVQYAFQPNPGRVDLAYIQPFDTAYRESRYSEDTQPNSRPIAIFVTDKPSYRLGEPITYIDLSYDPDAEGLPEYRWSGNKMAFFEPGTYSVSLQVRDGNGNWSEPEVQSVKVTDEPYLSKAEFPWYTQPAGTVIKDESEQWNRALSSAPQLSAIVKRSTERKRMSSGENRVIRHTGLIGQQSVNGKARLFMHHSNGMAEKVQFAAVIHNPDQSKTRTVHITREGLLQPTLLHQANAREAAVNYMTQPALEESIEVKPGETAVLKQVTLEPGQGFAAIQDIEADGQAVIGFVAAKESETMKPYGSNSATSVVEAVYDAAADIRFDADIDRKSLPVLSKWTLDTPQTSDRGTVYAMHFYHPHQAVIAFRAKEGYVNGIVRVNGQVLALPQGGLTDQDGAFVVYRAEGWESEVHIDWLAAPGSTSPVEWIFYPLEEKK